MTLGNKQADHLQMHVVQANWAAISSKSDTGMFRFLSHGLITSQLQNAESKRSWFYPVQPDSHCHRQKHHRIHRRAKQSWCFHVVVELFGYGPIHQTATTPGQCLLSSATTSMSPSRLTSISNNLMPPHPRLSHDS